MPSRNWALPSTTSGPLRRRIDWIKWSIWVPWIGLIVTMTVQAGGYWVIDRFYELDGGLTVLQMDPPWFIVYYVVTALFRGLPVVLGRRAGCHTVCWMAPFMILGRRACNLVQWPALRRMGDAGACSDCRRCTRACQMSLDVNGMLGAPTMENDECILCVGCVDTCPENVIRHTFSGGR